MADVLTPAQRSKNMAAVRGQDTKPELRVRSMLHGMGLRFRLYRKGLPGRPDIVLRKHRTVVFVHGCFWHRHRNCRYATTPATRPEFWNAKFAANVARDRKVARQLRREGWRVLTVWECELRNPERLRKRLQRFFESQREGRRKRQPLKTDEA